MPQTFYIVSHPIAPFPATEIASLAAKNIRAAIKGSKVLQFPLVDGGEGTIEQLITSTLGSFLEVEATSASGEQVIVPLGFAGEGGSIGVIEMRAIAEAPSANSQKQTKKNRLGFSGTTFGIGELITDALDEGAFSVILGWDEPLARDAGFGMAQALGVKFLDAGGKELDFKSESPTIKTRMLGSPPHTCVLSTHRILDTIWYLEFWRLGFLPLLFLRLQRCDDVEILKRTGVAFHDAARGDLFQDAAHDFSAARLRQTRGETHVVRTCE